MQWCEDLNLRNPTNVSGREKTRESGGNYARNLLVGH
jgi:hypothetical protein